MPEAFLQLGADDRRDALAVAADASGRPAHLLEKDVWVVWSLQALYAAPFSEALVFKGGTSLSKAYGVIQRFSEDVDLTYDVRRLLPALAEAGEDPLPGSRSEAQRWTKAVQRLLPEWVEGEVAPVLQARLEADAVEAQVRLEGAKAFIDYAPTATGTGYVSPSVMLEFGGRATGEPSSVRPVICDAAAQLPDLLFPGAEPRVMAAERTFWEKATAAHVYCAQGQLKSDRYARHWHDLVRLDRAGFAESALRDQALAAAVAAHKAMFFRETVDGDVIDYAAAVSGGLQLRPEAASLEALGEDYRRMIEDGLLEEDAEPFETLMDACAALAGRANAAAVT
nr:nucleotidyl transferase AbiEii/AbiGii toxin family protein [uncultured Brevundimonas sp.]